MKITVSDYYKFPVQAVLELGGDLRCLDDPEARELGKEIWDLMKKVKRNVEFVPEN